MKIVTKTFKILFMLFYSEIAPVLSNNTGQIVTRKRKGMIFKGQKALWRVCVLPSYGRQRRIILWGSGKMKGLEMRTGSLEERKKDKIKVHSPPCPKHACISAYPIRASPSPRLLLFLSSPTHALSRTCYQETCNSRGWMGTVLAEEEQKETVGMERKWEQEDPVRQLSRSGTTWTHLLLGPPNGSADLQTICSKLKNQHRRKPPHNVLSCTDRKSVV